MLTFQMGQSFLFATGAAMARALGMLTINPVFTRLGLGLLVRSVVAFALTLPLIPVLMDLPFTGNQISGVLLIGIMCKEFLIGTVLGLVYGVPFWAADSAGELIDLQRGSTSAQLVDPSSITESGITSTLFAVALVTLFFMVGGLRAMTAGLYESYRHWAPDQLLPNLSLQSATFVIGLLDQVLQLSLLFAAPIVASLFLADLALAYLARVSPQLHIFDFSLAVKNLLTAVIFVLYAYYIMPNSQKYLMKINNAIDLSFYIYF